MSLSCTVSEISRGDWSNVADYILPSLTIWRSVRGDPADVFGVKKTRVPGPSYGVVSVILLLAVLVQYRCVTDRRTHDDCIYRASIASRGKNEIWGVEKGWPMFCGHILLQLQYAGPAWGRVPPFSCLVYSPSHLLLFYFFPFSFYYSLYLFASFVHPFPFYVPVLKID